MTEETAIIVWLVLALVAGGLAVAGPEKHRKTAALTMLGILTAGVGVLLYGAVTQGDGRRRYDSDPTPIDTAKHVRTDEEASDVVEDIEEAGERIDAIEPGELTDDEMGGDMAEFLRGEK